MDVRAGSVISNRLPDGLYYPPGSRIRGLAALRQRPRARGRPRKASDRRESVGRLLLVLGLTPKPSCVRFRTFVKRSSELATAAMTQEVLGCRQEAARLKRTGQGYNCISGSFALRPHPRPRQLHDCRCSR